MIKLLHTADWHIGKMFFGRSMTEDQEYFFDNYFFPALERLGFGQNDCVVVAGDIFDRAVPPVQAIELFDRVITRVSGMGIRLFAVTGNHDGAARLSMGAKLMRSAGVYIYTSLGDTAESLVLDDGGTRVVLHPLPHFDATEGRYFLGDGDASGYADIFGRIATGIDVSGSGLHVLVAHCTAFGDDASEQDVRAVGGADAVPLSCFGPFGLTLLGHFHRDIAFDGLSGYCGSPLGYSFDSANTVRSMRYYEIDGDRVTMTKIPVDRPLHPLVTLTDSFERLMSDEVPGSDAFIYARLTDSALVFEPMFRLRHKFPNILGLCYVSEDTVSFSSEGRERLRDSLRSRTVADEDVFRAFLSQACGCEPTAEELSFFERLCRLADRPDVQ